MSALGLALAVLVTAAGPDVVHAAEPSAYRLEAWLGWQPDQPRDYPCNRGLDCMSASRTFIAGAIRGRYDRPDAWSAAATIGLGHHEDFERVPVGGFDVLSLRLDFQFELGRAKDTFGAALRVSPVVMVGWSDTGTAFRTDIPGLALLLGERDLWGEVIVPAFPTEHDPRLFYAGAGWRTVDFVLEGGFASFGSLGYRLDELDRASNNIGLWASGTWHIPGGGGVPSRWEAHARVAVAYPFIMVFGIGYRFDVVDVVDVVDEAASEP